MKHLFFLLNAAVAPAFAKPASAPMHDAVVNGPPLALAIQGAQTALATCRAAAYPVGVTVVDAGGAVRASLSDDRAARIAVSGSRRKAMLSAEKRASGAVLAQRQLNDLAFAAEFKEHPDWLARAGAFPIEDVTGQVIGAIAVEGQPHDLVKNERCAEAGLRTIEAGLISQR